jgi:hypothetical protein
MSPFGGGRTGRMKNEELIIIYLFIIFHFLLCIDRLESRAKVIDKSFNKNKTWAAGFEPARAKPT